MEHESDSAAIVKFPHHIRSELCTTRPPYRQGRKLTAVKVYTVNEESQHLLIRGVPALNLQKELKHLCMRYGEIKYTNLVRDYSNDEESFTEVYHVLFTRIQSARFAKHMIDDKSFYGGILYACYAPELESITETRQKLQQRRYDVIRRIKSKGEIVQLLTSGKSNLEMKPNPVRPEISSNRNSKTHQVGGPKRLLVDRKRQRSSITLDTSIPISRVKNPEQSYSMKDQAIISSPSEHRSSSENDSSRPARFLVPDKFLPSSLKRIKFNKI